MCYDNKVYVNDGKEAEGVESTKAQLEKYKNIWKWLLR